MAEIDLRKDAELFRKELDLQLETIVSEGPPSAIEIGYSCSQGFWIFIHADRRETHERDGEWTCYIDDGDGLIELEHWRDAIEALVEDNESLTLHLIDGTSRTFLPDDEEDEDEDESPLAEALFKMLYEVMMKAKSDGLFNHPSWSGKVQLDIEDFNGSEWGWPNYEDLGKTNLV